MRFFTILVLLATLVICHSTHAQNTLSSKRTYRVTAYKMGDLSITSTSNYAELYPKMSVYIPNAFTPNGDGMNDTFGVKGESIGKYELLVFDRWGEVIFKSENAEVQWDGKYKGKEVQPGAYAYKYIALGKGEGAREQSGTVTLVR